MRFSERLKYEAKPILEEIYKHPFIEGIKEGNVPKEALAFYVSQDSLYLRAFVDFYAYAITKCQKLEDITFFRERIDYILNTETSAHEYFCKVAGIAYEDLQDKQLAPIASLYTKHLLEQAQQGTLLDILSALAPCLWTYWEIGNKLVSYAVELDTHPFKDWILFYAELEADIPLNCRIFNRLDEEAKNCSEEQLEKAQFIFLKSCEMEWQFWNMAYYQNDWRFISNRHRA
jgi:thiaminase/transcriptional activator TenA